MGFFYHFARTEQKNLVKTIANFEIKFLEILRDYEKKLRGCSNFSSQNQYEKIRTITLNYDIPFVKKQI